MAKYLQKLPRTVSVPVFIPTDFSCKQQGENRSQKAMNPIQSRCLCYHGVDGPQQSMQVSTVRLENQLSLEA